MREDIVGEVAGGIVRFVGRILFAFLFEVLIRGVGSRIQSQCHFGERLGGCSRHSLLGACWRADLCCGTATLIVR
jgi:hypothetical protein